MQVFQKQIERFGISQFDAAIGLIAVILIAAIGVTVLVGDRVGVQIVRALPTENAHSTEPIVIQFSEVMKRDSVIERFTISPQAEGDFSWNGDMLIFAPDEPLQPASEYVVTVGAGAESENGRELHEAYTFTITVRTPYVAYLAPATGAIQNIMVVDSLNPSVVQQVTQTSGGVYDFAVSPEGTHIVFSQFDVTASTFNLYLLDIDKGTTQQITDCQEAECIHPVWRPDGSAIAYQREEVATGTTRVWLVELTGESFNNRPLFDDPQIVGFAPAWSADGQRVTMYDSNARGFLVHDVVERTTALIPNWNAGIGALAPDGNQLVFSTFDPGSVAPIRSYLQIADLSNNDLAVLTFLDDAIDDSAAVWHPNGRDLAIARRYVDDRFTAGAQLYVLNSITGESEPLVVDGDFAHGAFSWDVTGAQLLYQRAPTGLGSGVNTIPEVWIYDQRTDQAILIAQDAFLPQWVP